MRKRVIYVVYKSKNAQRMRKKCAKGAQKSPTPKNGAQETIASYVGTFDTTRSQYE